MFDIYKQYTHMHLVQAFKGAPEPSDMLLVRTSLLMPTHVCAGQQVAGCVVINEHTW